MSHAFLNTALYFSLCGGVPIPKYQKIWFSLIKLSAIMGLVENLGGGQGIWQKKRRGK